MSIACLDSCQACLDSQSRIVQEVIAVDLDIKWWHGETRLRQEDLGFEEVEPEYRDFLSKNIILGRKRLMPDQYHRELLRPERAEVLALPLRSPRCTAEREEVGAGL